MKNKIISIALIVAACFADMIFLTPVSASFPGQEKIVNPSLLDRSAKGSVSVIVTLKGYKEFKDFNFQGSRTQFKAVQTKVANLQEKVISEMGTRMTKPKIRLKNLPIFSTSVFKDGLKSLAAMDDVVFIEEDRIQELHTAQGIPLMNPGDFRSSYGGAGVAIAIVDSGVNYKHPALGGGGFPNAKVIGGYDFGDNDSDPMDSVGHGTACSALAAGTDTGTGAYIGGVAPEAKIYALKIMQEGVGIPTSAILSAWDWCISHQYDDPEHPIMIVSASLGTPMYHWSDYCDSDAPGPALVVGNLKANGIALFVSSGNEGQPNGISFSACLLNTIAVGAVYDNDIGSQDYGTLCQDSATKADQVICYSNSANILDLLAPSACAYSAGYPGTGYEECFNGTSAACPYAAGAAAVIQSYAKKKTGKFLSVDKLRRLMKDKGDPIRDRKSGITTPRVNISKSIEALGAGEGAREDSGGSSVPLDELRNILKDAIRQ